MRTLSPLLLLFCLLAITVAFIAWSPPAAAADKQSKTVLAVAILKRKDGACEQSEVASFEPVDLSTQSYSDFRRKISALCPVGNGKPCNLPVTAYVPEGQVALLVETERVEVKCTSRIIAFFRADTHENAIKQAERTAQQWKWRGYRVLRRWPEPTRALVEDAVQGDAPKP